MEAIIEALACWTRQTGRDIGESLSCQEAEGLARVFILIHQPDMAAAVMFGHGVSDEDPATVDTDDRHGHLDTYEKAGEYVLTLNN